MKKIFLISAGVLALNLLSGCVVGSSPYYGGPAPYYGTTFVPGYAVGETGSYYPYHKSQHIYSNYNASYWQHKNGADHGHPAGGQPHGGEQHGTDHDHH